MTDTLAAALRWLDAGIAPLPIRPGTKEAAIPWRRYQTELPAREHVKRWFESGDYGLAVICGWQGLTVLDFDSIPTYRIWKRAHPSAAQTLTVKTSRGRHVYLYADDPQSFNAPDVCEARGPGRYVLTPPSVHPSGARYETVNPDAPILRVAALADVLPREPQTPIPSVLDAREGGNPSLGMESDDGDTVSRIKQAMPLLHFAQTLTDLESSDGGRGRWYVGLCPFHDDHHPSLWLDAVRGRWGCFSPRCVAHRSGDVINLYALAQRLNIREAIARLAAEVLA